MDHSLIANSSAAINKMIMTEILCLNEITSEFGIKLSQIDVLDLIQTRTEALGSYGRIEFTGGIINKMILEFYDSPYISQTNYAATLNELIETFYYYKNETLDEISDDDLISLMKRFFDHNCKGSMALLQNRELDKLAHNIRYGIHDYATYIEEDV